MIKNNILKWDARILAYKQKKLPYKKPNYHSMKFYYL